MDCNFECNFDLNFDSNFDRNFDSNFDRTLDRNFDWYFHKMVTSSFGGGGGKTSLGATIALFKRFGVSRMQDFFCFIFVL